jgi:hypothetical protein
MPSQNYDPNSQTDQNSWVQPVNPRERNARTPQPQGQIPESQWSQPQGMQNPVGQDPLDMPLDALRRQVESQMHQAIDQYAGRLPGGSLASGMAKQAVSSILDSLERQADNTIDQRLGNVPGVGGMFSGNRGNEGSQL